VLQAGDSIGRVHAADEVSYLRAEKALQEAIILS
jgi:hypothetical protein